MTDPIPTAQKSLFKERLPLFPVRTGLVPGPTGPRLAIAGVPLDEAAARFGTPLYLYDQATLDDAVETYRHSLQRHYPEPAGLTYAGKAFLCTALAQWAQERSLRLDCSSAGELSIAMAGGIPHRSLVAHGVNKSQSDLVDALANAGTIVVDNNSELTRLIELSREKPAPLPEIWLRLRPGATVATHTHIQTGQPDSKFGFEISEAAQAVQTCLAAGLSLTGLHFHLGSQLNDPAPVIQSIEYILDFCSAMRSMARWLPKTLSPGGGWGVAYHEDDLPHPSIDEYVHQLAQSLVTGCTRRQIPVPHLQLEPGRSLIARAGVALYRVGSVKHTPNRRWLLLDGGMADNPRPALYGARYTALPVIQPERQPSDPAWLAGPYCESGDVLIEALPLPDLESGELIAVPVSGAYQLSMSSNYNGAPRPAVVWLKEGEASLIVRRETSEDLLRRNLPLPPSSRY